MSQKFCLTTIFLEENGRRSLSRMTCKTSSSAHVGPLRCLFQVLLEYEFEKKELLSLLSLPGIAGVAPYLPSPILPVDLNEETSCDDRSCFAF